MVAPIHCRKLHFKKKEKSMNIKFNQRYLKIAISAATALGIVAVSMPAYAGTGTSNMTVSSSINTACSISTTNISFGAYDAVVANASSALTAAGGLSSTCTVGAGGYIKISQGLNASSDSSDADPDRRMVHATDGTKFLNYEVFSDSDRSVEWENATGVTYTGTGSAQALVVYGSVTAAQASAIAGSYSDTLTVTINY